MEFADSIKSDPVESESVRFESLRSLVPAFIRRRRDERAAYLRLLGTCLRLPIPEVRRILRNNIRFLGAVEARRNQYQSERTLRRHIGQFHCPQLDAFKRLNQAQPGSRIIASFHFGDFAYGLNFLLRHDSGLRRSVVQTRQISQTTYFNNMLRTFGDHQADSEGQLATDRVSLHQLSTLMNTRPTNLVMFADLPPGFGATTQVSFLGRTAQFPRGIATLAMRNQFPVLPVVSIKRGKRHELILFPQIETANYQSLPRPRRITRLTQELVTILESALRCYPQQWRYLARLPAYFASTASAQSPEVKQGNDASDTRQFESAA